MPMYPLQLDFFYSQISYFYLGLFLDFGKANEVIAIMICSLSAYFFYLKINQKMSTLEWLAYMFGRLIGSLIKPIKKTL